MCFALLNVGSDSCDTAPLSRCKEKFLSVKYKISKSALKVGAKSKLLKEDSRNL